jgi:2-polyprenyl-6-methoxyphenol hydroxylase-like FAD-dependent oxidoreductase
VEYGEDEGFLKVNLDNGDCIQCTHVIAADGKWSTVRNSIPDFQDKFKVQDEPAFGVQIKPCLSPERWETDATTVFRPPNPKYYVIAAPLPDGKYSVSMVCFQVIQEEYPWLVPRDEQDVETWEAEYGARPEGSKAEEALQEKLAQLLQTDLPLFYNDIQGTGSLQSARINRWASWLKPLTDDTVYSDSRGRVALVGDSGHGMTAAIGEGCNCALESAVSLVESLPKKEGGKQQLTVEDVTAAFLAYGAKRPAEVIPIQIRSAEGNRYKIPEGAPTTKEKS